MHEPVRTHAVPNLETADVMRLADGDLDAMQALLNCFGLDLELAAPGTGIPGSFWGDEEAGLIGQQLWARCDSPVHSILHEACHFICLDEVRRAGLHTDAGGDHDEENAVCYLQILLTDYLPGLSRDRMCADMDRWGYSFRLGSARRWFNEDAADALAWLQRHRIVGPDGAPTWQVRGH